MNADSPLIGLCRSLTQTGLTLFIRSGLVLLLGLLLAAVLRRRGPLVQSLVYRATLSAVILTALFSLSAAPAVRPLWRVPLPASPADASETPATPPPAWNEPSFAAPLRLQASTPSLPDTSPHDAVEADKAPPTVPSISQAYIAVAALWRAGAVGLLVWLLIGHACLRRVRRRGRPLTTGPAADLLRDLCAKRAQRPIPLIASLDVRSPFLAGVWRPTIFLPGAFSDDFAAPILRAIFTHEIVHRDRGDNAWTLLARLTAAFLWTQPLLWLLIRRMEHASEEVCDALALSAGCSPRAYADCLLSLAERQTPSRLERSWGAGIVPFRSQLGRRIQNILHKGENAMPTVSARLAVLIGVWAAMTAAFGAVFVSADAARPGMTGAAIKAVRGASDTPQLGGTPDADDARFLAGLTAVQGPGVVVTLNDSHKPVHKTPPTVLPPSLIHDTDINQVITELKAAGAEAIAVNDQRLVATSSIRDAGTTVLVNNIPQTPPYIVRAIGDPKSLTRVLALPGGIGAELSQVDPAMFRVRAVTNIRLPAYRGAVTERYARPVIEETDREERAQARLISLVMAKRTYIREQGDLEQRLQDTERQLAVSQQLVKSGVGTLKVPPLPDALSGGKAAPLAVKRAYIQAVHEHNFRIVNYWNAVAGRNSLQRRTESYRASLRFLDKKISDIQLQLAAQQSQQGHP